MGREAVDGVPECMKMSHDFSGVFNDTILQTEKNKAGMTKLLGSPYGLHYGHLFGGLGVH